MSDHIVTPAGTPAGRLAHFTDPWQREAAVDALGALTAILNPRVAEHLQATAALTRRIGAKLRLPQETIARAELAAHVHDVGLNGVDVAILDTTAALSEREYNILQLHAERGQDVLYHIPAISDLAPIVRSHHERYDGTGYPDRKQGTEIPLESRIIAVADSFHCMTARRYSGRPLAPSDALGILIDESGKQFDAVVVNAVVTMFTIRELENADIA